MKLKHTRILIFGIAGVLAAIGSRVAGAEVRVDPSSLLTQSQVTAAFGEDFGAGQKINATACVVGREREGEDDDRALGGHRVRQNEGSDRRDHEDSHRGLG
jgi:hypothetical protein